MPYAITNSARLSKLILECPVEIFWKKVFFSITRNFSSFSYFERKFPRLLVEKTKKGCQISLLQLENIILRKKWKIQKDLVFAYLPRKQWPKILWQTCQNCICLVHRNTLKKFDSLELYFFLSGTLSVFFLPSGKKLSEVVKKSSYVSRKSFFSLEKLQNAQRCIFRVLKAKKKLRKLLAFYMCRTSFCRKKMKNPQRIIFRVLTKKFIAEDSLADMHFFCLVYRNTLRKIVSLNNYFFLLGFWVYISALQKKKIGEVVKTLFYKSRKSFFLLTKLKMHKCLVFSYLQQKRVCKNLLAGFSKVYLFCPR